MLAAEAALAPRALAVATPTAPTVDQAAIVAPGYGPVMAASFGAFRPRVRTYWDGTTFYVEGDNMPDNTRMPNLMVGITSWQQQIPLPASYFSGTTNPERDNKSTGFGRPNVWRLPLVPTVSSAPIPISAGNFQRGAIAVAVDGVAIFNPRNNTGRISYEIGELDVYGGHCGLADDYHYHIAPVHLQAVVGSDKPIAWALDGYPIYGYAEPDGSAREPLDPEGGHNHGSWNYHYHAIGSATAGPQNPYLPTAFHGSVINYGGQVDGQPEVSPIRADGTGGYSAKPVTGASIVAFKNPVALEADSAGHLVESTTGVPSQDQFLMRVRIGTTTYDECWRINRWPNPKTVTITWRLPGSSTTTATYNSTNERLTAYAMGSPSLLKLPDTGQTIDATPVWGEDSDYTINEPSYVDNGDGTITDRVTGLMWQKVDAGETTWENAVTKASAVSTGGYSDWRLPTPSELFSIVNHNNGNPAALNTTYFPSNPSGAAEYWWTTDIYGADATKVWCVNSGGGLGPKPKNETLSAGGTFRYHARYVRGAKPGNGHNYSNNLDGTITDLDTGLMWTQVPGAATTWTGALTWAENLTLAGYSDWRLPNIKELQTLVDYTLATATTPTGATAPLNRTLFPTATTPAGAYWSSTALRGGGSQPPTSAWLVEFGVTTNVPPTVGPARGAQGIISYETMNQSHPVFAVRKPISASSAAIEIKAVSGDVGVTQGGTALLTVAASGSNLDYKWYRGAKGDVSSPVSGEVMPYLVVRDVTASETYWVRVSDGFHTVDVPVATISIVGAGSSVAPEHKITGPGYVAGQTLVVTNTIGVATSAAGFRWSVLLPPKWSFVSTDAQGAMDVPVSGQTDLVEWSWAETTSLPLVFSYVLKVPAAEMGPRPLVALFQTGGGGGQQVLAKPDPLSVAQITVHSADQNQDFRISLAELTRVIELYNTRFSTVRTGCYAVAAATVTEDGFAAAPNRAATEDVTLAAYHTADSNRDGRISLSELTRVVELYNYRSLGVRTGQYSLQAGTEDGFVPGP